jgi:tripeptide aminopeptidase
MRAIDELLSRPYATALTERFLRYARIDTTSDRHVDEIPSTPTQWNLARLLVSELEAMGAREVSLDEHCYLFALIPASPGREGSPSIGLMAHMDTSSDVSCKDSSPRLVKGYDGRAIELGIVDGQRLVIDPAEDAELAARKGDTIAVADGRTLLGADDKAGIAEIMTAADWLLGHPEIEHGPVELIFTPDEETGKGMNLFPMERLRSKVCYTVDAGRGGEIEAECFNAYSVKVTFKGRAIHIGTARGKLANAVSMAGSFISMLPRSESPEATDGWYGYFCPLEVSGGIESATLEIYLRDFDSSGMERRLAAVRAIAKAVEAQYPLGSVTLNETKQYVNMKRRLDERPEVLKRLMDAANAAGADPFIKPIRGGTDGARLTEMGIPTPNVFAGMHNYHSRFEWASLSEMVLSVETLLELVRRWAG